MAEPKKTQSASASSVIRPASANKEARESFAHEERIRIAAERNPANTLMNPDEVAGAYDLKRQLFTTIDGKARLITIEDLARFRDHIHRLERDIQRGHSKKFIGITPKQVIDLSHADDIKRANEQIKTAFPIVTKAGQVRFQTNAGPQSDRTRHYVDVLFLNYEATIAAAAEPAKLVKDMIRGPIKMTCDCGRSKYWYSYIQTIAKCKLGYAEHAFPKIRNPGLHGIACKHIIRVMHNLLHAATMLRFGENMIRTGRASVERKSQVLKKAEIERIEKEMRQQRTNTVRTSEEKRLARAAQPSAQARAKEMEAAKKAANKPVAKRPVSDAVFIRNLLSMGFTEQQAKAALAATKAQQ